MTVKQERDAIKAKLQALREAVNLEEIHAVVDTLLAQLEEHFDQYECYEGIGEIEEMKYRAAQIHAIYKAICHEAPPKSDS